jgi:Raf kinase inhibitor-like YbhB/YbcL family protein
MKIIFLPLGLIVLACVAIAQQPTPAPAARPPAKPGLALTTSGFPDGTVIPAKYSGYAPKPASPDLEWDNVPASTVSFTLIMHDPDTSPKQNTEDILHWMMFNIPGSARSLPEGVPNTAVLPDGSIQAKNFRGRVGYMGPGAPSAGPYHHYTWELYALDTKLDLTPDATRAEVLKAMDGHVVAKAAMFGQYHH